MTSLEIPYVFDDGGEPAERETAYLLRSDTMKRRLLEAKERKEGLSIEMVLEKLGI
jgi:hypothetical protein